MFVLGDLRKVAVVFDSSVGGGGVHPEYFLRNFLMRAYCWVKRVGRSSGGMISDL